MSRMQTFAVLMLLTLVASGCRTDGGTQVVVEQDKAFPPSLAGRWQSDLDGWQFTFEPDGDIASAVLGLGQTEIEPGEKTVVPTRTGEEAVFEPGPWTVHYEPATRELTVRIVMDHIRVPMGGNVIEGASTDILTGPVSPATGVWQAQWTAFTRYTVATPAGAYDLSTDPTYGETKSLTFERTATND